MGRLENKVAIITGGNSGIGACAAKLFAKEGAKVVISARRTAQLEEIADEIKKAGGEVLAVSCDISGVLWTCDTVQHQLLQWPAEVQGSGLLFEKAVICVCPGDRGYVCDLQD